MKITAVICTYNRYDLLARAIQSLTRQTMSRNDYEIIVVDNSPSKSTSMDIKGSYNQIDNLIWIYESKPGLSNARNVAAHAAQAPIIAYLDDDAEACTVWLDSLCSSFDECGEQCQVVGGKVLPLWGAERPKWLSDKLLGYVSVVDLGDNRHILGPNEWIAGANIAYRNRTLLALGGFDVSLGRVGDGNSLMSSEEVALTDRISDNGGLIVYDPVALIHHLVEAKRINQGWFRKRVCWQAVSDIVRSKSGKSDQEVSDAWLRIKDYFYHQKPQHRTVRSLYLQKEDADQFQWQLGCLYDLVICNLSGIEEVSYIDEH